MVGREELLELALRFLHAPFQAGGRSIFGMDALHVFPLIFAMAGYAWPTGKLPGRPIEPEEIAPGDILVGRDEVQDHTYFALYLGAEQVFWMDHRMQSGDLDDWEEFLSENTPIEVEISMHRLLN